MGQNVHKFKGIYTYWRLLNPGGDFVKVVSQRLRYLRESVKLSQVKMGEVVGVKQSALNRYE